ncbi:conserved phage C-terminal domain-containing protein [Ureibacillus sp. GCM10028918]|uniref:conserved phage C-terminal domain-containing protein n=1 Tax=Ureibacillus sp. GCM10028918 TaxID=3273429 RepID=UPI00361F0F0F
MKPIIDEPFLLIVPPSLAVKIGLNEAIVLNQLHYRLSQSPLKSGGFTWYHHTYTKWQNQFPFWSERTIVRIFLSLENQGIIVSSQHHNAMKINKTKWYRIDYDVLHAVLGCQIDNTIVPDFQEPTTKVVTTDAQHLAPSDLKELIKEEVKEKHVDFVFEVVNYLNKKTNKEFRASNKATKRLINGRLSEGYTLKDFQTVIDRKVHHWLTNPEMKPYLRPSTLFSATNFENYLNEPTNTQSSKANTGIQPIVLDFDAGEED